jgi:hypothetical protein
MKTPKSKNSPITLSLYTLDISNNSYILSSSNILTPFIIFILYFFIIHFFNKSDSYSLVSSLGVFIKALLLGEDLSKMLD